MSRFETPPRGRLAAARCLPARREGEVLVRFTSAFSGSYVCDFPVRVSEK